MYFLLHSIYHKGLTLSMPSHKCSVTPNWSGKIQLAVDEKEQKEKKRKLRERSESKAEQEGWRRQKNWQEDSWRVSKERRTQTVTSETHDAGNYVHMSYQWWSHSWCSWASSPPMVPVFSASLISTGSSVAIWYTQQTVVCVGEDWRPSSGNWFPGSPCLPDIRVMCAMLRALDTCSVNYGQSLVYY